MASSLGVHFHEFRSQTATKRELPGHHRRHELVDAMSLCELPIRYTFSGYTRVTATEACEAYALWS